MSPVVWLAAGHQVVGVVVPAVAIDMMDFEQRRPVEGIQPARDGTAFLLWHPGGVLEIESPLLGGYNVNMTEPNTTPQPNEDQDTATTNAVRMPPAVGSNSTRARSSGAMSSSIAAAVLAMNGMP